MGLVTAYYYQQDGGPILPLSVPLTADEVSANRFNNSILRYFFQPADAPVRDPVQDADKKWLVVGGTGDPIENTLPISFEPSPGAPSVVAPPPASPVVSLPDQFVALVAAVGTAVKNIFVGPPPTPNPPSVVRASDPVPSFANLEPSAAIVHGYPEPNPPFAELPTFEPSYAPDPTPTPIFHGYPEPNPPSISLPDLKPSFSPSNPGPRIIDWIPMSATPNPPTGYQSLESFPLPGPTQVQSPIPDPSIEASLRPVEYFPTNPGHGWFWDAGLGRYVDLSSQFLEPAPAPIDPPARIPDVPPPDVGLSIPRQSTIDQATRDAEKFLQDSLIVFTPAPSPAPVSAPPTVSPSDPISDQNTMAARRSLAGPEVTGVTGDNPDSTPIDTNALLQKALDTVGNLAGVYMQGNQTTGPSASAAPKTAAGNEGPSVIEKWIGTNAKWIPWALAGLVALLAWKAFKRR